MKSVLAALVLILSTSAFAETTNKSCDFTDYQHITTALGQEIRAGKELVPEVLALMAQEMGPSCTLSTSTQGFGRVYNLISGETNILIVAVDLPKPGYTQIIKQ